MTFVNLTPHEITFIFADGNELVIPPSGNIARVSVKTEKVDEVDGIPVTTSVFGEVEGLPEPKEGTAYLVSSLVAQRVQGRDDVFIPSDSVRDSEGRIFGCRSLGRI